MSAEPVTPLSWYQSLKQRADRGDADAKRKLEKHRIRNKKARKRREAAAKKAKNVSGKRVTSIPLDAIPAPAKKKAPQRSASEAMQKLRAAMLGRPPTSAADLQTLTKSSASLKGVVKQLQSLVARGDVRETQGVWNPTLRRVERLYELRRTAVNEPLMVHDAASGLSPRTMRLTLRPGTDITVNIGGVEVSIVVSA